MSDSASGRSGVGRLRRRGRRRLAGRAGRGSADRWRPIRPASASSSGTATPGAACPRRRGETAARGLPTPALSVAPEDVCSPIRCADRDRGEQHDCAMPTSDRRRSRGRRLRSALYPASGRTTSSLRPRATVAGLADHDALRADRPASCRRADHPASELDQHVACRGPSGFRGRCAPPPPHPRRRWRRPRPARSSPRR